MSARTGLFRWHSSPIDLHWQPYMEAAAQLENAYNEVLKKTGRNLLMFQLAELLGEDTSWG